MTQKAYNLDHLRQCSEFVPHPGIGNPSFVSGNSVVIQGKTTRFEGSALGTTVHRGARKVCAINLGILDEA